MSRRFFAGRAKVARRRDLEERNQALEKRTRMSSFSTCQPGLWNSKTRSTVTVLLQLQFEAAKKEGQLETFKQLEVTIRLTHLFSSHQLTGLFRSRKKTLKPWKKPFWHMTSLSPMTRVDSRVVQLACCVRRKEKRGGKEARESGGRGYVAKQQ